MARRKTEDLPDLEGLLMPPTPMTLAVERTVLRDRGSGQVTPSLAEQIAAKLAGLIALDMVHAGQRLLEQDISAVLGVSRAPLREALRILQRDGLVEFGSRKGAMVKAPDTGELYDLFRVRAALYRMLLEDEVRHRPVELRRIFERHLPEVTRSAADSVDAYAVSTFVLNSAVAERAGNRTLADLLQSLSLQTLRYVRLGLSSGSRSLVEFEASWQALYAAIATPDVELVGSLATQRIARIRDAAVAAVQAADEKAAS